MATLSDHIRTIAARHPVPPSISGLDPDPVYYCDNCRDIRVQAPGDLCEQCTTDQDRGYCVRSLTGRCANGAERDHGTRFHALPAGAGSVYGDHTGRALCGAKPGRRSVGWSLWGADKAVTCPRCIAKLEAHR